MGDIAYDVDWFKRQIAYWDAFEDEVAASWVRLSASDELPELSERFPADLREVAPKLNAAKNKLMDNLAQAEEELRAMRDAMVTTAKQYVDTNATNQDKVEQLKGEIDP